MKKIMFVIACLIVALSYAGNCKRCKNKGYFEDYIACPLCRGFAFISPAWFNMDVGNTRWVETTYWTGLQTKSDVRKKMFSFKKCPLCDHSMKKGGLRTVFICSCENRVKMKPKVELAKQELFKLCLKVGITSFGGIDDFKFNDWRALNAWDHLKRSSAHGSILQKLVYEYLSEDFFDHEAADYKRDTSKYQKRKFFESDECQPKDGDWVTNIESGQEEENDD